MNDLFKKLNVLVNASIHDVLGDDVAGSSRRVSFDPHKLGKDIDREITMLRGRINDALAYEDELQARVNALGAEVADWDKKADDAVTAGNDEGARAAIDHMARTQQRAAMAEADLRDHQRVTQELILRVNTLEATVADVRRAQSTSPESQSSPEPERGQVLSDVLKDVRERITRMGEMITATDEVKSPVIDQSPVDDQVIDDDLESRRQRLSKPK